MFLYDIKHMNREEHVKCTGVPNDQILDNSRKLSDMKKEMIVRYPVIPGYNDSMENVEKLARFLGKLNISVVHLLPYHRLGVTKYERLGMSCPLGNLEPPTERHLEGLKILIESHGITCRIGGD